MMGIFNPSCVNRSLNIFCYRCLVSFVFQLNYIISGNINFPFIDISFDIFRHLFYSKSSHIRYKITLRSEISWFHSIVAAYTRDSVFPFTEKLLQLRIAGKYFYEVPLVYLESSLGKLYRLLSFGRLLWCSD